MLLYKKSFLIIFILVSTNVFAEYEININFESGFEFKSQQSLIKILKEPKNSLIKQYKRLFEFENVELEFQDDAILEIAKKAIKKKTGARGLRSILENILLKTMFELPDKEDVLKVTIDKSSAKGDSDPIITYGKKQSTSVA